MRPGARLKACYNPNNLRAVTHQDGLAQAGKVLLDCREKLPSFLSAETAVKDKNNTIQYIRYHAVHYQVVEPTSYQKHLGKNH